MLFCLVGYHSDTPISCEVPLQLGFVSEDQRRKTLSGASKDSEQGLWCRKLWGEALLLP